MNELYASIVIGTAAALLAAILLLLRTKIQGQRPAIALARWWVAASTRTSGLVLALLVAIAVSCFAPISMTEQYEPDGAPEPGANADTPSNQASRGPEEVPAAQEFEALKAYADDIDSNPQPVATASSAAAPAALPGSATTPSSSTATAKRCCVWGDVGMEKNVASSDWTWRRMRSGVRPVTMRARRPRDCAAGTRSLVVPGPKTIRCAVANSKRTYQASSVGQMLVYLTLVRGEAIISATVSRQRL